MVHSWSQSDCFCFQFEKAAIESKKQITKLEEENSSAIAEVNESRSLMEKKEEEMRAINKKVQVTPATQID